MHERHQNSAERFQRSPETISRHVHIVVEALCRMAPDYIRPPYFNKVPDFVQNNAQLFPYFKANRVGAIDGTIIPAWVPSRKHGTYRSRKGTLAQNVMAACDFNLNFTFVLAGWKGSANDSRKLPHIVSANQTLVTTPGKYYVVDSGYANFPGFLSPYHGERYHLPEWVGSNSNPSTMKELFNRRHATVRNIIERCFGSLKKRFAIIKGLMPNYKLLMKADIVIACCVIHNFVRKHCMADDIFQSVADPDYIPPPEEEGTSTQPIRRQMNNTNDGIWEQSCLRDSIAASLWGVGTVHVRSIHASVLAFSGQVV
ncbi:hypothetical protein DH2020_004017 [Rehmannia glutinosa]|uniref:DDE Tnp4 domain-containing protein n=1 Tax=Rehmannia glutinosa TaxID=99300 RepID=A0ABR0XNN8_REHGL